MKYPLKWSNPDWRTPWWLSYNAGKSNKNKWNPTERNWHSKTI